MPETRTETVEHFDQSEGFEKIKLGETKTTREVSDGELEREAAERAIAQLSTLSDNELTVPQAARFLKALAKMRR